MVVVTAPTMPSGMLWGIIIAVAGFFLMMFIITVVITPFVLHKENREERRARARQKQQESDFFEECLKAGATDRMDTHRLEISTIGSKYYIRNPEEVFDREYKARFGPRDPMTREQKMKILFCVTGAALPLLLYVIFANAVKNAIPFPVFLLLSGMFAVVGYAIADSINWKKPASEEPDLPALDENQQYLLSAVPESKLIRRSELLNTVGARIGKQKAKSCYDELIRQKLLYEIKIDRYYYTSRKPIEQ